MGRPAIWQPATASAVPITASPNHSQWKASAKSRITKTMSTSVANSSVSARSSASSRVIQREKQSAHATVNAQTAQVIPPDVNLMRTVLISTLTRPNALRRVFAPPKKTKCAMMHTRLCQGRRTNEPNVVPIQGMCTFPFTFLLLSTVRSFSTLLSALSNVDFHFLPICLCFPRIVGASRALSESSQRVHAEILVDLIVAVVNPTQAIPMVTVQAPSVSLVSGLNTCPTVPVWRAATVGPKQMSAFFRARVATIIKVMILFAALTQLTRGRTKLR